MRTALLIGAGVATGAASYYGIKAYKDSHGGQVDEKVAEVLKTNTKLFNAKELALIAALIARGQTHLFSAWPELGTQDANKRKLVSQLVSLDRSYHGGLCAYIDNAKKLLADSKEGRNPFEGYTPNVPSGEKLDFASTEFIELEKEGLSQAGQTAFVLVAGGLGERLGYSGIKVALPCESASGMCFLELYARFIHALQVASGSKHKLPFAIMTSDDTHARTQALLESHKYFGLDKSQVHLMKQEKVACLIDNDATLALDPADTYAIQTKPHGHGDVHALLHSTGLAKKWHSQGFKWVTFFQDTNALVTRALVAALGVSARHGYDMNSLAVPRKAKEAIGAIARLQHKDGNELTINVEYNQLDPLLRATCNPAGDVNDETGWSPYPGNINQLILKLDSYAHQLARTGGLISEFVNPKYKDASKTAFKSSTRLECMMQDYPKALPSDAQVGFTTINQVWASYSPVKNNAADALSKFKEGNPTHSATTGELDIYRANCYILEHVAKANIAKSTSSTFNGITADLYPRAVLTPEFAPSLADVENKIKPGSITLASNSVLVLDGSDINVQGPLEVSGAVVIRACRGASVKVLGLSVANAGWQWKPLAEGEDAPEELQIRGFRVVKNETAEYVFDKPGSYTVGSLPEPPTPAPTPANPIPDSTVAPAAVDVPKAAAQALSASEPDKQATAKQPAVVEPAVEAAAPAPEAPAPIEPPAPTSEPAVAAAAAPVASSNGVEEVKPEAKAQSLPEAVSSAAAEVQSAPQTIPETAQAAQIVSKLADSLIADAAASAPAVVTESTGATTAEDGEEEEGDDAPASAPAAATNGSTGASTASKKKKKKKGGRK